MDHELDAFKQKLNLECDDVYEVNSSELYYFSNTNDLYYPDQVEFTRIKARERVGMRTIDYIDQEQLSNLKEAIKLNYKDLPNSPLITPKYELPCLIDGCGICPYNSDKIGIDCMEALPEKLIKEIAKEYPEITL